MFITYVYLMCTHFPENAWLRGAICCNFNSPDEIMVSAPEKYIESWKTFFVSIPESRRTLARANRKRTESWWVLSKSKGVQQSEENYRKGNLIGHIARWKKERKSCTNRKRQVSDFWEQWNTSCKGGKVKGKPWLQ